MDGFIAYAFSLVCAQDPAHTWAPGGIPLPFCQRCTGLYVGACAAMTMILLFRPVPGVRFRTLHASLLFLMAPFGFHLVPQEAVLRTMSGYWFGFGIVGLLWLLPDAMLGTDYHRPKDRSLMHFFCASAGFLLLPAFASLGGRLAADILPWLAWSGLLGLAALLTANVAALAGAAFRSVRFPRRRQIS